MSVINKDLGVVTAYAYAVEAGYTGTEEEFEQALGDLAELVTDFENFTVEVTTLEPGSSATASYANGVLSIGIPEGEKGDTGATPNLTIGTVTTLAPGSDATATITGTDEAPVLSLGIPEGNPGEVPAAALASEFSASVSYKKGDYVWKSGTLYEFTADHAAGAWTGSDATAAKVADDVANLSSAIDWEKINGWTEGRYIKTSGSTCDPTALITSPTYRTVVLDCVAGENFTVSGTGGHDPRLWAFIDAENNVLIKADAATTANDLIITAPSDATKLILNSTNWNVNCYRGITPQAQGQVLEGHIRDAVGLVGTPLAGILPTTLGNYYPEIDTEAQTFTIWNDSILFDRRLNSDGYFSIPAKIVVSYASIVSTAIAFWWDIDNATVYPARFGLVRDPKKFILIALFRKNKSAIASSTPIVIDGKINGAFDPSAVSALQNDKLWANNIVKSINHRGYMNIAPENTLPAFQMSKAKGYKYVEADIQFTSDDVAVLLHDASINRTARNNDGTELSATVNIADITYAQALQYDFGIWKGAAYAGTRIPTFEEFMVACKRLGLHPYIEMKVGTESQIASLYNTVKKCGMTGKVTWISYNTALLGYITALGETERVGYISSAISATRIESATALRTGKNEVFFDADNASAVTDEGVNLLISANLPLEVFAIGTNSILALNNYVSGITNNADNVGEILYENYNTQDQ